MEGWRKEKEKKEGADMKKKGEEYVERQGGLEWKTEKGVCDLGLTKHCAIETTTA